MSLDGAGSYQPPAPEFPAIPNTTILTNDFNTIILDIAAALSQAIFRDGQAAFTANQSMGSHKLTNLATGTNLADAVNLQQVFFDPAFVATTVDGFQVTGTMMKVIVSNMALTALTLLDMSSSGEVKLPANSSIGAVSPAELAVLNGVTATTAEINTLAGILVTTAELNLLHGLTATTSELNYVHGVTSALQDQLDALTLLKATIASPSFTGIPLAPTAAAGTSTTQIATTAFAMTMQSPAFSGTPTVPTAAPGTNNTQTASTAFAQQLAFQASLPVQISDGIPRNLLSLNGVSYWALAGIVRNPRTSNSALAPANSGSLIAITSGTFTQTFVACATLGANWYCYLQNSGSGDVTLDPNGAETIDGLASYIMYPGEARLIVCDGTSLWSIVLNSFYRTYTSTSTFTKPPGYRDFQLDVISAGGGGSLVAGGGGGGRFMGSFPSSTFSAAETITVGAGGVGVNTLITSAGGSSSIGTLITVVGGSSNTGEAASGAGGSVVIGSYTGSSEVADGWVGAPGSNGNQSGMSATFGGGSGGFSYSSATSNDGGSSMFAAGAGGGCGNIYFRAGGISGSFAVGGGGAANPSGVGVAGAAAANKRVCGSGGGAGLTTGGAGGIPGGGGGGSSTGFGGSGARGEVRIGGIL